MTLGKQRRGKVKWIRRDGTGYIYVRGLRGEEEIFYTDRSVFPLRGRSVDSCSECDVVFIPSQVLNQKVAVDVRFI